MSAIHPSLSTFTPNTDAQPAVEIPRQWKAVDDSDDLDPAKTTAEESVVVTHTIDDYVGVLYRKAWEHTADHTTPEDTDPEHVGIGRWTVEYVDPDGTTRMGSQYKDDPQAALDSFADFVQQVRASEHDRKIRQQEVDAVEWPDELGGFELIEHKSTAKSATYELQYYYGHNRFFGLKSNTLTAEIRLHEERGPHWETQPKWGIHLRASDTISPTRNDEDTANRKTAIIDMARDILAEMYDEKTEIEANVIDKHRDDINDDVIEAVESRREEPAE